MVQSSNTTVKDSSIGCEIKRLNLTPVIADPTEYLEILSKSGKILKIDGENVKVFNWKTLVNYMVQSQGAWHFKFAEKKRFIS